MFGLALGNSYILISMNTLCNFTQLDNGWWKCLQCGYVFKGKCVGSPNKNCDNPPNLTPLLAKLADLTNHPEIVDQPQSYGRAVQQWAAGGFETRTDDEVEFIQTLCQANVCQKHRDSLCKPSCGTGMIIAVKALMATEGCPHRLRRW